MFDSHIHIGQFNDLFTSPETLADFLDSVGVDRFAVSSTSTCERNYDKVLLEMRELISLCGERVLPVLWVLPEMFNNDIINFYLDSGICWRMLKIHPQTSPIGSWKTDSTNTNQLISLARNLNLPILIHTGEINGCYPEQFNDIILANPDINFVLAHGRPLIQIMVIMESCPNCWCDTAFMPTENIVKLCEMGLSDRVLWGTDYPITKYYYPDIDQVSYYRNLVCRLKSLIPKTDFQKITHINAESLFSM